MNESCWSLHHLAWLATLRKVLVRSFDIRIWYLTNIGAENEKRPFFRDLVATEKFATDGLLILMLQRMLLLLLQQQQQQQQDSSPPDDYC